MAAESQGAASQGAAIGKKDFFSMTCEDALKELGSSFHGLTANEAGKRLQIYGPNELERLDKISPLKIFLNQFKDAFILLLLFAGLLTLVLGEFVETIAILVIILLNSVLGFIQEYRADRALEALKKISAPNAKVIRDGAEHKIKASEVVPGDIILLESGDIVPADARLLEVSSLQIDEASLTGESMPSKKKTDAIKAGTPISDQDNMVFMGSVVTYGKGKAVVTSTGMKTEFGKIALSLESTKETKTPLQVKFEQLAKQIGIVTIILIALVLIVGTIRGNLVQGAGDSTYSNFFGMLVIALTLTVSTIPNSLPLVVTVGLSIGTQRLARKNMLIKKLPAAESLGAATIICSDKTGTITKNQMTVTEIYADGKSVAVSGTGYKPEGEFFIDGNRIDPGDFELLCRIGYLCNNAKLEFNSGKHGVIGDPTEGALIVLGKKAGLDDAQLSKKYKLVEELPFDSDRKRMSVIYKNLSSGKTEAYVKGAPDLLLGICTRIRENGKVRTLTAADRKRILAVNNRLAGKALRVLGFAYKEVKPAKKYSQTVIESDLTFVGLAGMIDPPRDEVKEAIEKCHAAGIKVMIITGDHAITTKAVAVKIGLFKEGDIIITGEEMEQMSDAQLLRKIDGVRIIARALPIHKSRVVDVLQKQGHIVAMTGDGVNDAPALKKADIGIAMGITGTDVAKEVAKATLTDDNFATIVNAIEEGRNIYNTLIRSAKFFLACNTGEITTVFVAVMFGMPLPLLALQILLMNILTDNLPALGLGFESPEEGIMNQPPRDPKEKPITGSIFMSIITFGLIMGIGTLLLFRHYLPDLSKAQTVAFTTLVMFQMFAVISSRSLLPSLKELNPFSNLYMLGGILLSVSLHVIVVYWPPLQSVFGTVALSASDWGIILLVASLGFVMMELSKFLKDKKKATIKYVANI